MTGSPLEALRTGAAEHAWLTPATGPIAALVAGPVTGAPVLLVPGYTGSKEDFGPLLDPLAKAGYRVTAIDLPGQYESPGPTELGAYSAVRLGDVVRAIAAELGPQVRLLGHSFGGLVSRAAVIAEPSAFASLVLLSSGPAQLGGLRRRRIEQLAPVLSAAGLPGVYAAMQAAALAEPGFVAPPAELAEFLQRRFLDSSPDMLQGMGDALRSEPDRVAELAGAVEAAGLPVLVVHGENDDAWPPDVQHDMASRLGARYVVIPHAAHSAAVENPAATLDALTAFWR